jgi:hypothetical protein
MTASSTQAVYAEMVSGDGLNRAVGRPAPRRAVTGMEMNVRDVLTIDTENLIGYRCFSIPPPERNRSALSIFTLALRRSRVDLKSMSADVLASSIEFGVVPQPV